MKSILPIIALICYTKISFAQQSNSKGHYFKTTTEEYFNKVIKPWNYQFIPTTTEADNKIKIGQLIFWRTIPIEDKKSNWKPNINLDIYPIEQLENCISIAQKIKLNSTCDSINKGGDVFIIGNFVLLSSSTCVDCASSSNIDYCRNILKKIFESVKNLQPNEISKILSQFPINKGTFSNY